MSQPPTMLQAFIDLYDLSATNSLGDEREIELGGMPSQSLPCLAGLSVSQPDMNNRFQFANTSSSTFSNRPLATADQPSPPSPDVSNRPSSKRYNIEEPANPPAAKSIRLTPPPRDLSRVDLDEWQQEGRITRESLKTRNNHKELNAASAQNTWTVGIDLQQPAIRAASLALGPPSSQYYMNPDGLWQVPISQQAFWRHDIDYQSAHAYAGSMIECSFGLDPTPLNTINASTSNLSTSYMPGYLPSDRRGLSFDMSGPFVSENSSNHYSNIPVLQVESELLPRGFEPQSIGSSTLPFNDDAWPSPPCLAGYENSVSSAHAQQEIKALLNHVRRDEEITDTQQQEAQPDAFSIDLMPHQRKGYAWMTNMEQGGYKGGILADDMGLGKTVQALALILARPPATGTLRPTLIVAPVALMQQWEREIKRFVKSEHRLNVLVLHGENRNKSWDFVRTFDVVLTTYGTLISDPKRNLDSSRPRTRPETPILGDDSVFHRVILDEAQNVKNSNTKAAAAACKINATYRWCLSGTPMQNNVDEIYSLIKFCRIRPYHEYEIFAREIGRPLKRTSDWGKGKAMQKLQTILKAILLRRTKESKIDGQPILQLPEKRTLEEIATLSKDELDFYKQLESQARIQFNRYIKNGTVGRYYSHALVMLLRLRQCCCSPQLVTSAKEFVTNGSLDGVALWENAKHLPKDVIRRLDESDAYECPICMDGVENPILFVPCGHTLCNECLGAMVDKTMNDSEAKLNCPHCRAEVGAKMVTDLESYLRLYYPERPGVNPIDEDEADDSKSDTLSESSEADLEDDDDDDGADLKDFVVPDDDVDNDNNNNEVGLEKAENTEKQSTAENKPSLKADKKSKKAKIRTKDKEKGKAKTHDISLADLRKEGLGSKPAKKRYLRRLEKGFQTSAKIEKTLDLLREINDRGQGENTILFSSFTSFLDLLEVPLHRDDELSNYARYDGSMKSTDRNGAVTRFTNDPHCKVMLISLKAGNSGLNLTAANHVILLDPSWNPFVEYQAADRCYRIGQQRDVTIHRILIGESEDLPSRPDEKRDFTIEDRILRLQDKKREQVEMALDENAGNSLGRLTTQDLGFLFGVNSLS